MHISTLLCQLFGQKQCDYWLTFVAKFCFDERWLWEGRIWWAELVPYLRVDSRTPKSWGRPAALEHRNWHADAWLGSGPGEKVRFHLKKLCERHGSLKMCRATEYWVLGSGWAIASRSLLRLPSCQGPLTSRASTPLFTKERPTQQQASNLWLKVGLKRWIEQWPKHWWFAVYRWLYYPVK